MGDPNAEWPAPVGRSFGYVANVRPLSRTGDFLYRCCRLRSSFGVAIEETSAVRVVLERLHQQFPLLDLRLRRAAVTLNAIEQSRDTAKFGGR